MRQIDDKWRGDMYESNYYKVLKNLFNNYNFTEEDNDSIQDYINRFVRIAFSKKCSNICFDLKTLNFNSCVDSCLTKYIQSQIRLNMVEKEFNEKYNTFQTSGSEFF
jgi:hypothetical protein